MERQGILCEMPDSAGLPEASSADTVQELPLLPHISESGELSLIYNDYILPYVCPMIDDETELDERFLKATFTVWKHLIEDPLIYDFVWEDSRVRDRNNKLQ